MPGMHAYRLADPAAFLATVDPLIASDEARHNLIFGLAATLRDHPAAYPTWHLWVVKDADTVVGAALHTPPRNLTLARPTRADALDVLGQAILEADITLAGVSGAMPEAADFAERWVRLAGGSMRRRMAMGIYKLTSVSEVPATPGSARQATADDHAIVTDLVQAFMALVHTGDADDPEGLRRIIDTRLGSPPTQGGFWLWEDGGQVVSLSGHSGPTPHGIRIGPVYTPPELRGRGYATSLVAAQSAWLLANGHQFCFLYTDLTNPTSNAIYQRIGYEQVCEAAEYAFEVT
jgi:hypothetical protein